MKNVEDMYPLSHMQEGMLFHTLLTPESGAYTVQFSCAIEGSLNVAAFKRSWETLVERHTILRTCFVWDRLDKPLQVVRERVKLSWDEEDWRALSPEEQDDRLETDVEHQDKFDMSKAPLIRLKLIRRTTDSCDFIWTYSHLLLDGWSSQLLFKELFTLYEAYCRNRQPRLPQPVPYRNYIAWLQTQNRAEAEAFWRRTFKGFTAPTPLGVDNVVASLAVEPARFSELRTALSTQTTATLQTLARRHRLTLNTFVQGAWAILLHRYSDEDDVVFGTTVMGRPVSLQNVESMMGLFINTLPLRVQVSEDEPLSIWLKKLQDHQVELRQYEHTPLVQVQGWSEVPRGTPVFESLVVFENHPTAVSENETDGELKVIPRRVFEHTNYPITLLAEPAREMVLRLVYDCRRFDKSTISRTLNHLATLLQAMADNLNSRVSCLSHVPENEREKLLKEWNDTRREYEEELLHEAIERQAERRADGTAVVYQDQHLSYGEMNRRANRIAHELIREGVGVDSLVGVCMKRSLELVVTLLGILKAGGAYVPLDAEYPQKRLRYMVEDAEVKLVLTQEELVGRVGSSRVREVAVDREWEKWEEREENPRVEESGKNLAYMIYTSGTTGEPKGVGNTHEGIVNRLRWMQEEYELDERDRILQKTPMSFDVSVWEFFWGLMEGATIVEAEGGGQKESGYLVKVIKEEGITTMHFVPSMLQVMMEEGGMKECRSLERVICSGEALPYELMKEAKKKMGGRLDNLYGPTEAAVDVSKWRCEERGERGRVSIGRPISNMRLYVLDGRKEPVGIGVGGELHIAGVGLARGYQGKAEMTAEKFIPDPYSEEVGGRMYRSGDMARWEEGGEIEYLGRKDEQVKIRGNRIELGEVEGAIREEGWVREAAVVVKEGVGGEKRLVGYIVKRGEEEKSWRELRERLSERLPEYMVPGIYVMLEEMPVTGSGKIDRKRLPEPSEKGREEGYEGASNEVEEELVRIWEEVLGVERVGTHDNFFELGGHSILAMKSVARMRESFDLDLPVRSIFSAPTVAELARQVEIAMRVERRSLAPSILPASREANLPLSFAQQRLWLIDQLEPGGLAYNLAGAVRLTGELDVGAIEQAINEVIRRHEILRTTVHALDDEPIQVIGPFCPITLGMLDLRNLGEAQKQLETQRLAVTGARRPFDLTQGPMLRARLLWTGEKEHVLLMEMHHIVSDGWSMEVLVKEVGALYKAFWKGNSSSLAELPIQYADYAVWQREWLKGEVLAAQLEYWKKQLGGKLQTLELLTDKRRPTVQSYEGGRIPFSLSRELTDELKKTSRREEASLFMLLLAAFAALLHRYSGQEDIAIGSPVAGRNRVETESLIGFFVNTIVLRTDLRGDPTFKDLLARVKEVCLEASAHQDAPFERLVEELQPERDLSQTPLFQAMFALQNNVTNVVRVDDVAIEFFEVDSGVAKFALTLFMAEAEQGMIGSLEYSADFFDRATAARMAEHFQNLVGAIGADPGARVSRLSLLSLPEREQLLVAFNESHAEFPQDCSFKDLFEKQVEKCPDAVAVVCEDGELTYGELNRAANRVAHSLGEMGVGPDDVTAVLAERGLEFLTTVIGIFKAGGAYLPLDPRHPAARIAQVIVQSKAQIVLTAFELLPVINQALDMSQGESRPKVVEIADLLKDSQSEDNTLPCLPTNLAYVIFTSGSTGLPKGAMIEHRGMINHLYAKIKDLELTSADIVAQNASQSFDISVWQFLAALLIGGSVHIFPDEVAFDPVQLLERVDAEGITVLEIVPSLLRAVLDAADTSVKVALPALRWLVPTGETLPPELCRRWLDHFPGTAMMNAYGPTECSDDVSHHPILSPTAKDALRVPIGQPVANMRLYVFNRQIEPSPIGVAGELYVGGVGVGRGYMNEPARTAEVFTPDPFALESGSRLYKTGDLARVLQDGTFQFLGRLDYQVKIRGFRIELSEIEWALSQHPAVREATVIDRDLKSGDKRLEAYIVFSDGANPSTAQLRTYLQEKLPAYMIPAVVTVLDAMPLTDNGKTDRQALAAIGESAIEPERDFIAPRIPTEEMLASIWTQVLGVEQISVYDNLFEVGGHSLLATQINSRIRREFQSDLPLRTLFESPTIAELTRAIVQKQAEKVSQYEVAQMLAELEALTEDEALLIFSQQD